MWRPSSEADILHALQGRGLVESDTFDAKADLPVAGKSLDLAIDVAAMATGGGVLLYGVAEDEGGAPTVPHPIILNGVRERVDQIVRSGISEPPYYESYMIPTSADRSLGYLVLVVPPSERAPHMVTVKGENRYYHRSISGNTPMSEAQVAALYERRQYVQVGLDRQLREELNDATSPVERAWDFAFLKVVMRPVLAREDLFARAASPAPGVQVAQTAIRHGNQWPLPEQVQGRNLEFASIALSRFESSLNWRRQVRGWVARDTFDPVGTVEILVTDEGLIRFFAGRVGQRRESQGVILIFAEAIASYVLRVARIAGLAYGESGYFGSVLAGLRIANLNGATWFRGDGFGEMQPSWKFEEDEYLVTKRIPVGVLVDDWQRVGSLLLDPFIESLTQGRYRPFS